MVDCKIDYSQLGLNKICPYFTISGNSKVKRSKIFKLVFQAFLHALWTRITHKGNTKMQCVYYRAISGKKWNF